MKQLILCLDVEGRTERLRALQAAHPHVIGITPHDKPCAGFTPVEIPEAWLPEDDGSLTYSQRCWHACGTLGLAAVAQLGLIADAFWMIESDCVASQRRWHALLADHDANEDDDAAFICARSRAESQWNPRWQDASTPAWADLTHLNAIYRLSPAAIGACLSSAIEMRACFGEMVIGSVVKRAGLKIGSINRTRTHLNNQTMKADPARVLLDRMLINHPIKSNTFEP